MIKQKSKNFILSGLTLSAVALPIAFVVACGDKESSLTTTQEDYSKDENIKNIKELFKDKLNTSDELEIIFNKIEVKDQFEDYVGLFNKEFGTKLKGVVVGGNQSIDSVTSSKLSASGDHNILLTFATSPVHFEQYETRYLSTPASEMLDVENLEDSGSINFGEGKQTMSAASEGFGLIYNKDLFEKLNINVHEGEETPSSITIDDNNPEDGIYGDEKKDVYTSDLTKEGFEELANFIETTKDSDIKPFYPLSKTGEGNIWPMTNHLVGVSINQNVEKDKYNSENFEDIYNTKMIESIETALDIYGHDKDYNKSDNTVDKSIAEVALGKSAMVQNGTWNNESLKENNEDGKFGFMPMPIFDEGGKAVITKSFSLWVAKTDITKDNEKNNNTAKAFLQSLFKTKVGIETLVNDLSFNTPFIPTEVGVEGEINFSKNQLFSSLNNYSKSASSDDQKVKAVLNNNNASMREWIQNKAPNTGDNYEALKTAWSAVLAKNKS